MPLSLFGSCDSSWIAPKPPYGVPASVASVVSPVSVKKNFLKPVPGLKTPFSGRLNGVPPAFLAAALASNAAVPSVLVSWIVTHSVLKTWP